MFLRPGLPGPQWEAYSATRPGFHFLKQRGKVNINKKREVTKGGEMDIGPKKGGLCLPLKIVPIHR